MHQEYDNFRGGWAQIDDDGYEIGFIKDLNAPQHKQKKKKSSKELFRNRKDPLTMKNTVVTFKEAKENGIDERHTQQ